MHVPGILMCERPDVRVFITYNAILLRSSVCVSGRSSAALRACDHSEVLNLPALSKVSKTS